MEKKILKAIKKVVESGQFVLGEELHYFEKELAKWAGVKYAIGVNSGTDGLLLSIKALAKKKRKIITTPFSFFATAEAIINANCVPVFSDVGEDCLIDPDKIKIKGGEAGIIPVHLFNKKCDMAMIKKIAVENNLFIIEDSCQHFSKGIEGNLKVFSFYPTKMLGGFGDGGAVLTNDEKLADRIKMLRNHGIKGNRYIHHLIGYNSRLDEIQAAILRVKLKEGKFVNKQKHCDKYYPLPIHLQPYFRKHFGCKEGDFPVAEKLSSAL